MTISLKSIVNPLEILRDSGVDINRVPSVTSCVLCRARGLQVYDDDQAGAWLYCPNCHFSGDAIEYASAAKGTDVPKTLRAIQHKDANNSLTSNVLDEYLACLKTQQAAATYWHSCSQHKKVFRTPGDSQEIIRRAYKIGLLEQADVWSLGLGQFLGLTTVGEYNRVMHPTQGYSRLAGRDSKPYLLSPMFSVPSKLSGFAAFDVCNDTHRSGIVATPYGTSDALLFYRGAQLLEDTLFAIGDLTYAVALQVLSCSRGGDILPVVGYTPATNAAWANVRPRKIVFWNRPLGDDLFLAARKVPHRAYIATGPTFNEFINPFEILLHNHVPRAALTAMEASAVPWLQALKDEIIGRQYGDVKYLIDDLALTADHKRQLLSYCATEDEKALVSALIDTGVIEVSVPLPSKPSTTLVQKHDGWYLASGSSKSTSLASAAVPVIDTFTQFDTRTIYHGSVRVGDAVLPFEVDGEEFGPNWLETFCRKRGHMVTVASPIRKDFEHLTIQMHAPETLFGLDSIGWNAEKEAFLFPRYTIARDGEFEEVDRPLAAPHPAASLSPTDFPDPAHVREWLLDTTAHAAFWAAFSCVIGNILAPALGEQTTGIAVVMSNSDVRDDILKKVVDLGYAGRHTVSAGDDPRNAIQKLLAAEAEHRVPLHVQFEQPAMMLQWARERGPRNAVAAVPQGADLALRLQGGWTFLDPKPLRQRDNPLIVGGACILPGVLSYFQRSKTSRDRSPPLFALRLLRSWLHSQGIEELKVLTKAERLLDGGYENTGKRFLAAIRQLLDQDDLTLGSTEAEQHIRSSKSAVVTLPDSTYLHADKVYAALRKVGLQAAFPTKYDMTSRLRESGILIKEDFGIDDLRGWYIAFDS